MVGAPTIITKASLAKGSGQATHSTTLTTRPLLAIIMGIIMIHLMMATPSTLNIRRIARTIGATTTRIAITTKIPLTTILTIMQIRTTLKRILMRMICIDRLTLIMEHLATTILLRFQVHQMAVKMVRPLGIQTSIMKTHMEQDKQ
jgi:hypothetical protein